MDGPDPVAYEERPRGDDDPRSRDARTFADNVEELVAATRPGEPVSMLGHIDGSDRSGTVHCVVDDFGDVVDVGIDRNWWGALGPSGVAAGILDALDYARSKVLMAQLILDRYG